MGVRVCAHAHMPVSVSVFAYVRELERGSVMRGKECISREGGKRGENGTHVT